MKSTATVLIATALAVIAAATVFIALQVFAMADRVDQLEGACIYGTVGNTEQGIVPPFTPPDGGLHAHEINIEGPRWLCP